MRIEVQFILPTFHDERKKKVKEMEFREVSFDPRILMKGHTPIQRQEMVDESSIWKRWIPCG